MIFELIPLLEITRQFIQWIISSCQQWEMNSCGDGREFATKSEYIRLAANIYLHHPNSVPLFSKIPVTWMIRLVTNRWIAPHAWCGSSRLILTVQMSLIIFAMSFNSSDNICTSNRFRHRRWLLDCCICQLSDSE